jgi:cell surface protein SprA
MALILKLDQLNNNQQLNQLTSGNKTIAIEFTADYQLGPNFTASLFYKRDVRKPKISSTFETYNTNIGVSLRFTLAQ